MKIKKREIFRRKERKWSDGHGEDRGESLQKWCDVEEIP